MIEVRVRTETIEVPEYDHDDPSAVWKHAIDCAARGMIDEASDLFKHHAALINKSTSKDTTLLKRKQVETANGNECDITHSKVVTEGGLKFIPGAITSHTDIGFTPYFDKNLKELKGPLPLTIFNKQWQDLANSYHVEKRVKTDNINKDTTTYTGYPYPHEMTQSYATWNVNYRNLVTTLRDVYKFKLFASWAEAHQANVEFYHARDNWMSAFRYDIKIRMNAFAFRVTENGTDAPPDISQRREDVAAICFAETRRLDEGSFTDNPYAKGGCKYGFDWTTGLPRSNNHMNNIGGSSSYFSNQDNQTHNNQPHNHNGNSSNNSNNKRSAGRFEGHPISNHKPCGGYHGKNFDPQYAAKKAAAAASKSASSGSTT